MNTTSESDQPDDASDREVLIQRMDSLVSRLPPTAGLIELFLEHLEEIQPDERTAAQIMAFYDFCRRYPKLALLMTSVADATQ